MSDTAEKIRCANCREEVVYDRVFIAFVHKDSLRFMCADNVHEATPAAPLRRRRYQAATARWTEAEFLARQQELEAATS
jgi:hypothetical protein